MASAMLALAIGAEVMLTPAPPLTAENQVDCIVLTGVNVSFSTALATAV